MSSRVERLADLLRSELSEIIRRDVRDPRVGLATVSNVTVSRDLGHAVVRVSVLGDDADRETCVDVLDRAKGFIRSKLARRVHLRAVPELDFRLDRGAEHSQRITELLETLDSGDADGS